MAVAPKVDVRESERGLVCAFDLASGGMLGEESLAPGAADAGPRWLHFNLADTRARHFIEMHDEIRPARNRD